MLTHWRRSSRLRTILVFLPVNKRQCLVEIRGGVRGSTSGSVDAQVWRTRVERVRHSACEKWSLQTDLLFSLLVNAQGGIRQLEEWGCSCTYVLGLEFPGISSFVFTL